MHVYTLYILVVVYVLYCFGSRAIFLLVLGPWVATRFRATGLAVFLRRVLEKFFGHVLCVVFFWPLRPERVLVASAACARAAFSIALVCANSFSAPWWSVFRAGLCAPLN